MLKEAVERRSVQANISQRSLRSCERAKSPPRALLENPSSHAHTGLSAGWISCAARGGANLALGSRRDGRGLALLVPLLQRSKLPLQAWCWRLGIGKKHGETWAVRARVVQNSRSASVTAMFPLLPAIPPIARTAVLFFLSPHTCSR